MTKPGKSVKNRRRAFTSRDPAVVAVRILDAAQAEFMRVGPEAANTNDIAAAFGGSKATLFRYFPTKNELLEAVVRRIASDWHAIAKWESIEEAAPRDWLLAFGEMTLTWLLREDSLFVGRLAISEAGRYPSIRNIFPENASRPLHKALVKQLRRWEKSGAVASISPDRDARLFFDMTFAGAVSRALYGVPRLDSKALSLHVESCVNLFLRGLRPT
ncbi:MAG: TetR/AcrR family transcriptional regulator [Pseudomonadota bacterium]